MMRSVTRPGVGRQYEGGRRAQPSSRLEPTRSAAFEGQSVERDLDDDCGSTLDMLVDPKIRQGMPKGTPAHCGERTERERAVNQQVREAKASSGVESLF